MALGMGVARTKLPLILPNIGNFYNPTSGEPPLGYLLDSV
jgi:hypothetical protein